MLFGVSPLLIIVNNIVNKNRFLFEYRTISYLKFIKVYLTKKICNVIKLCCVSITVSSHLVAFVCALFLHCDFIYPHILFICVYTCINTRATLLHIHLPPHITESYTLWVLL